MKKIRILYYYPFQQYDTGSPKSLVSMISTLNSNKFEPFFVADNDDGPLNSALRNVGVTILLGRVELISLKRPVAAYKSIHRQIGFLKDHSIQVVHLNHFGWNEDLAIAAKLLGIPVILHLHNSEKILWNNLNRFCAKRVLCCSRTLQGSIENIGLIQGKLTILYNLVDIEWIQTGTPIGKSLNVNKETIVVGTIAQICHRKGIDNLVEVARNVIRECVNVKFLIVGPVGINENEFLKEIELSISKNKLEDHIYFLGSRSDIPDILASFDIFFLPTRVEPFGIVIIEAMASNIPVVASKVGGIPEIITNNKNGYLFEPNDLKGFSSKIVELSESKEVRDVVGKNALKAVSGRFDKSTIGKRLEVIYDSLLSS
jgi:glycosyltransferase involved in cell wall biosynthesis